MDHRSFLNGEQGTSEQIQSRIATEIDRLSACRRLVLIDGVGFPSVGSVCGVDNVDVAIAASAPVILIGKSGVGGAIDSFNLNAAYFAQRVCCLSHSRAAYSARIHSACSQWPTHCSVMHALPRAA